MREFIFANLLIASSTKTHNSQSSDSRNQNLTYGIMALRVLAACTYTASCQIVNAMAEEKKPQDRENSTRRGNTDWWRIYREI